MSEVITEFNTDASVQEKQTHYQTGQGRPFPNKRIEHPGLRFCGQGRFKWVVASEDMPSFGVQAGHHMAIDPVEQNFSCVERKIYLFATATGYHFLGRYRGLPGGNFEAVAAAGDVYNKAQHGLVLLARFRGALAAP